MKETVDKSMLQKKRMNEMISTGYQPIFDKEGAKRNNTEYEVCSICGNNAPVGKFGGKSQPICIDCLYPTSRRSLPIVKDNLPGRNDMCHCGSGIKFKKCCLKSNKI